MITKKLQLNPNTGSYREVGSNLEVSYFYLPTLRRPLPNRVELRFTKKPPRNSTEFNRYDKFGSLLHTNGSYQLISPLITEGVREAMEQHGCDIIYLSVRVPKDKS